MERQLLLSLTTPMQAGVFMVIAAVIYGRIEKKSWAITSAYGLYALLGIYAAYVYFSGFIPVPNIADGAATIEGKARLFFLCFMLSSLLSVVGLGLIALKKQKARRVFDALLLVVALFLFFVVYNFQKYPA